jgi:hypothetical protein
MGPYFLKLAKVIRYARPVVGATGVAAAGPGGGVIGAKMLVAQIKLMEELAPGRKASKLTFPCCKPRK